MSSSQKENIVVSSNGTIAKNTLILYVRMFVTVIVSLYTSRVILANLGVSDFGIYNVVGGIVSLLSLLNVSLSSATQRFLNLYIGKRDFESMNKVFNQSITLYIILGLILFVLGETIGLWYIENKIVVPVERINATFWVYQFTIIASIISLLRSPFLAGVIAYEKMTFFAYLAIVEVIIKLLICYAIVILPGDRLETYALLIALSTFLIFGINVFYCHSKLSIKFYKYYKIIHGGYRELVSFSGWTMVGSVFSSCSWEVLNLVYNYIFGIIVNAAMGICMQVLNTFAQFILNFQTAYKPPIIKAYASGQAENLKSLIIRTSKFSFYMVFLISLPLFFSTDIIMKLWLKEVPQYTSLFVKVIILHFLLDSLSRPFFIAVEASGKIKRYQILSSLFFIVALISACIYAFIVKEPVGVLMTKVLLSSILILILRFVSVFRIFKYDVSWLFNKLVAPIFIVISIAIPLCFVIAYFTENISQLIFVLIYSMIFVPSIIYLVGMDGNEKNFINNYVRKITYRL